MTDARQEEALTELLSEIARADRRMAPPRQIEQRVMEQWDTDARTHTPARASLGSGETGSGRRDRVEAPATSLRLIVAIGGLAAAVVLAIALKESPSTAAVVPASVLQENAAPRVAEETIPAPSPVSTATRLASPRRIPRPGPRPPVESERDVVGYVPLSPTAQQDLAGSFQIARVRLPRELLADLGVMVDANRMGEPVEADVVFGEDGLARAIRLAPVSWRSQ